jgi:hypothetical protein
VLVEQVEVKEGTEVIGLVHRSLLASPQVYKVKEMESSVGSVTHREKFTFPSPSVSNRAQASRVLFPLTLISSQFHVTWREVGRPELSIQSCVRSFCPGSSLAPAVSFVQLRTASTEEDANTASPMARNDATSRTRKIRGRDLMGADLFLERSRDDESMAVPPRTKRENY